MKYISKLFYSLGLLALVITSCNDNSNTTTLPASTDSNDIADSSDSKYNPAGYHQTSDTYNPSKTATDTMYQHNDSIPK